MAALNYRFVCVGWVAHCLDRVIVQVEAEQNTLVERVLWLERRIDVMALLGDEDACGVVDRRVDDVDLARRQLA